MLRLVLVRPLKLSTTLCPETGWVAVQLMGVNRFDSSGFRKKTMDGGLSIALDYLQVVASSTYVGK